MKCCVSTDVGTWTNWLTFESDPDYSPDAGTGLLSPISFKHCYVEFYVGENLTFTYWPLQRGVVLQPTAAAQRGFNMVSLSRRNIFVGGTCAPPSALLASLHIFLSHVIWSYHIKHQCLVSYSTFHCYIICMCLKKCLLHTLPFNQLSLVGLALDLVD